MIEIESAMVLSTAHIDPHTLKELNDWSAAGGASENTMWSSDHWIVQGNIAVMNYGFLVRARIDHYEEVELPQCIDEAIRFAETRGITWLIYDCDASEVTGLSVHEH